MECPARTTLSFSMIATQERNCTKHLLVEAGRNSLLKVDDMGGPGTNIVLGYFLVPSLHSRSNILQLSGCRGELGLCSSVAKWRDSIRRW